MNEPKTQPKTQPKTPGRDEALALLREMIRIRRFEERAAELYTQMKIRGFLHLYDGEEAVAAGVMPNLRAGDAIVATYREHGHAIARGISMGEVMAELYGCREGVSRGRGGSMHLYSAGKRLYGGNAIVGGGLPLAVGLALADRMLGRDSVTACFFGEGAVAEGEFHESMNLAALWKLPVLFVCENNLYAMGTALERSESVQDIAAKAASYGVPARAIDGMDVEAVLAAAGEAAALVRSGAGPCFLECRSYRFRAHSMFDAQLYRDKSEVERWRERCPIVTYTAVLRERGHLDDGTLERIEREVAAEVEAAVDFAEQGTLEPVEQLADNVYASL
jgi:pyruvate dehydrogenase E1 component alpha subunit/2-oxoisovalerate dehydrogenase E1 component